MNHSPQWPGRLVGGIGPIPAIAPDVQAELAAVQADPQFAVEQGAQGAVGAAIAQVNDPGVNAMLRIGAAAVSGAISGFGSGVALGVASPILATALTSIGIDAAVGAEAGPIGAVVGAVIGVVSAVINGPWATGSGDTRTPTEKAADAVQSAYLNSSGALLLFQHYVAVHSLGLQPSTASQILDSARAVMAHYQAAAQAKGISLPDPQAAALTDNATSRMPPPELVFTVLSPDHTPRLTDANGSPNPMIYLFAGNAVAGSSPAVFEALCDSLSAGVKGRDVTSPLLSALEDIKRWYEQAQFAPGGVDQFGSQPQGRVINLGGGFKGPWVLPPPPRVINLGQGSLAGLAAVELDPWVAYYLGEGKPPV